MISSESLQKIKPENDKENEERNHEIISNLETYHDRLVIERQTENKKYYFLTLEIIKTLCSVPIPENEEIHIFNQLEQNLISLYTPLGFSVDKLGINGVYRYVISWI